jgi:hypothetical protein
MRLINDGWRGPGKTLHLEVVMTSATMKPASGTAGRHAEGQGYGLLLFAAVLLLVVGER